MSEHCTHEKDILFMMRDLYNDGKGIKYRNGVLWEQYIKSMGKRDILIILNSVVLTVCSVAMVFIGLKIL